MVLSIQYLRGIASFLVLLQHTATKGAQYANDPLSWFTVGGIGVDIFFLISGFIMCHATAQTAGLPGTVPRFLKNRVIRVLPLYWILTSFALLVFLLFPDKINIGGGVTSIADSYLLLPTDGNTKYLIKNGWTLSYEFFFYVIFSLSLFMKGKKGLVIPSIILLICGLLRWASDSNHVLFRFVSDPVILNFLLGFLVYLLFQRFKQVPPVVSLLLVAAATALLVLQNNGQGLRLPLLSSGIPVFLLSLGLVWLEPWLQQRPVAFLHHLGDASYSLYLSHPFALAGGALLLSWLGLTSAAFAPLFVSLLVVLGLAGGFVCFRLLEKPLIEFFRTVFLKKKQQ